MKKFINKLKYDPYELADALVIDLYNLYSQTIYFYKKITGRYSFLKKNKNLKNIHSNKKVFILGNAPSINDFDLSKLKNEIVFMVNRSFMHKDYDIIKPKYHIFVDPKLATGVWPIEYLDIVLKKNPDVNLILNSNWYYLDKFKPYREMKNVFWVKDKPISLLLNNFNYDLTSNYTCSGVIGHAFAIAAYSNVKKIYLMGIEANGIIYLMSNKDSHFSGKDPDYKNHTSWNFAKDMTMSARGIRTMHRIKDIYKKLNIEVINLNKKGLLDMFPQENYEDIID